MPIVTTLNGRYLLWKVLSQGSAGQVWVVEDRRSATSPQVLKTFPHDPPEEGMRFYEELARITSLRHPHLNPTLDCGRIKQISSGPEVPPRGKPWEALGKSQESVPADGMPPVGSLYLVAPYLGGGHLGEAIENLLAGNPSREELDRWLTGVGIQVLEALRSLHDGSLLHFDIKPEHILFPAGKEFTSGVPYAVIIDLGLSARESTPLGTRVRGTFP